MANLIGGQIKLFPNNAHFNLFAKHTTAENTLRKKPLLQPQKEEECSKLDFSPFQKEKEDGGADQESDDSSSSVLP
ncbi:hypothetical protein CDAR_523251 [Caerostris darwini]|uniref:Uncharacterized protein n=1 Tax=Caerostris darwini TaxID=1538125 RepID=A0AAV4U951_9ARAC|nr:hypothetical protein CDAR_523251 [Caerostris darwini]